MKITEQQEGKTCIIALNGRLDTNTYTALEKKLGEAFENDAVHILLDLSDLMYVSSSGLRVLLMYLKRSMAEERKFILCGLRENIREIFDISGFTSIFEIYSTRGEALKKM
ncbi:MAG: STAS domain-containing protein [Bacteroidales bacterium]